MRHNLDKECRNILYNSYINSNFNYCQTVWMLTSKTNMDKLEKTNKRALRLTLNAEDLNYEDLCRQGNQLSIYRKCMKQVAIQMYKIKNDLSPSYVQGLFNNRIPNYDISDNDQFRIPNFETITYGKTSFRYYGAKLWGLYSSKYQRK